MSVSLYVAIYIVVCLRNTHTEMDRPTMPQVVSCSSNTNSSIISLGHLSTINVAIRLYICDKTRKRKRKYKTMLPVASHPPMCSDI